MATGCFRVALITRHIWGATHNIKCSSRCRGRCNMPSRCSTQFKTRTMTVLRVSATRSCKRAPTMMSRRAIRRRRRLPVKVRASERTRALAQSRLRCHRPLHPPLQYHHRRTIPLTLLLVSQRAIARIATAAHPKATARARNRTACDAENGPQRRRIMRTGSFRSSS